MGTLEERVPPESESVSVQERKIFSNFTRPHPSNTDFTRCVGNAQGPERCCSEPDPLGPQRDRDGAAEPLLVARAPGPRGTAARDGLQLWPKWRLMATDQTG